MKPDYTSAYKQSGNITFSKKDYASALDYYKKYEEFTKTEITDYLFLYRDNKNDMVKAMEW